MTLCIITTSTYRRVLHTFTSLKVLMEERCLKPIQSKPDSLKISKPLLQNPHVKGSSMSSPQGLGVCWGSSYRAVHNRSESNPRTPSREFRGKAALALAPRTPQASRRAVKHKIRVSVSIMMTTAAKRHLILTVWKIPQKCTHTHTLGKETR